MGGQQGASPGTRARAASAHRVSGNIPALVVEVHVLGTLGSSLRSSAARSQGTRAASGGGGVARGVPPNLHKFRVVLLLGANGIEWRYK